MDDEGKLKIGKVNQELNNRKVLNFSMSITDGRQDQIKLKFDIKFIGIAVIKP
jgi:hypothetical protein